MRKHITDKNIVSLIGRTNVGKSTLFNKLTEKKAALISNVAGTTRDRRFGEVLWRGETFVISDTAGLDVESEAEIDIESIKKAKQALKESALVLFVVEAGDGLMPQDKEFNKLIKKQNKNIVLVVNKVDNPTRLNQIGEFEKLGIKNSFAVSAKTGAGLGDLLDYVYDNLKLDKKEKEEAKLTQEEKDLIANEIKIAILGKPNVGKSSLINSIIGKDEVIVSPIAHTTRESQDLTIEYKKEDKKYRLTFIDTAGMIKKRKISDKFQEQSIEQSLGSLAYSDLALLVIDADKEITAQDKNIAKEILERSKSLMFIVNKWDLVKDKDTHSDKVYIEFLHRSFPYLTWAPVIFTSAKTGFRVARLIDEVLEINDNQTKKISEQELAEFKRFIIRKQSPKKTKGTKPPFIHIIRQIKTKPQTFEIIADTADNIHFSYRRFITNQLREKYGLWGCGVKLVLTEKNPKKSHQT
ncbi:ribosome biogenesis GTPase Der [Candidatus Falkowbacteria bacterium]|jgi:GTPase|nr:ribosome biogenesis GTPase Der [Candidatus Falkowbacteria bacterium]MBT7007715.1 ribosome biogenesis GTPase Der [Candidatus Falkowbacteria bacterium]